ncbi:hypothetical protein EGH10_04625 [Brevibacillus laterosporus]|uniref:Uncharacterized protein n=1 Tax=Brevibacillus laterosporus LMG 15441 TaxID=1042163 RepID=A0A075R965_BRELA|nr:hypothetical protein BRLA_c041390 [Brevibacillus laterosporus LMG 15441]RJL13488.1 hypothetical protein DM460_05720 [Brevibacillus laterosporus]TPH16873.1 hypothetical protein EGH10_04625 [Brevibacillus laterosporus]HAS01512.1 hypothetical protein [Brevibacillus sp.]
MVLISEKITGGQLKLLTNAIVEQAKEQYKDWVKEPSLWIKDILEIKTHSANCGFSSFNPFLNVFKVQLPCQKRAKFVQSLVYNNSLK